MSAREDITAAVTAYADEVGWLEGGFVTGYVVIAEVVAPDGQPKVLWATGNGNQPTEENSEGLAWHRIAGLLQYTQMDVGRRFGL